MGQADAAPTMPRYDPYLRRACVERVLKLHDRNYGYRIVPSGDIVGREFDAADSLVFVSEPFNDVEEFSGLFCGRLKVEINKRNFDFRSLGNCQINATSNSRAISSVPATWAT